MKHTKERAEMAVKVIDNLQNALETLKDERSHPIVNQLYRQINRAYAKSNKFYQEHVLNNKESKNYWYKLQK